MHTLKVLAIVTFLGSSCTHTSGSSPLMPMIADSKHTVFFWWATKCPCVTRYQNRIEAIQERYKNRGLSVIAIASNHDDTAELIAKTAAERNFNLRLVKDVDGTFARYFNIRTTPTSMLIDQDGKVQYVGSIDNERDFGESGRVAYLENAIEELFAGKQISMSRGPFYGCPITKSLRR